MNFQALQNHWKNWHIENGFGVEQDCQKAFELYKSATNVIT